MTPDERANLKALQDRLDRYELHGDVGRMVFLAVENAADERDPSAVARAHTPRRRRPRTLLGRLYDAFAQLWRRR